MASRFMPTLRDLAMEPDEDRRLEMAAEIDRDAADLDEKWGNRDGYAEVEAERDRIAAERDRIAAERDEAIVDRDEWKRRYADRFFGGREGVMRKQENDIKRDGRPQSFADLFKARDAYED